MNNPPGNTSLPRRLEPADKAVLTYGAIAAVLGLILYFLATRRLWPLGNLYVLTFLLQFAWLPALAGAMLAGMRGGRRWLIALAAYGLVLPALSAYGLCLGGEVPPHEANGLPNTSDLFFAVLLTGAGGFILLPLIQALDASKLQWNYPAVFRAAWRNAVHLGMAGCLTLAVCLLLWAAGAMFRMIGIPVVHDIVAALPFKIALWPMILAASLVGARRRPQLAEMLQRSWLTLNAWLLPLVTLVGVAFTIALAARLALDLQAVTLSAGALIAFSLLWIKLINAAWQDSEEAAPFGPRLRRLLRLGMVCLLPLAAVAAYGIAVRVGQYGWTISRVWAAYACALAGLYGLGYACAALRPRRYYATLGATNLIAAGATLALLAAIASSWASPQRLAVQSQVSRLMEGRVEPDRFRYVDMKDSHGQWGRTALQRLADGAANAQDPRIALAAADALEHRYYSWDGPARAPRAQAMPAFSTYPHGRDVPQAWWAYVAEAYPHIVADCLPASGQAAPDHAPAPACQLILADISGDGEDDVILYVPRLGDQGWSRFGFFAYNIGPAGTWRLLGRLQPEPGADESGDMDVLAAIRQGLVRTAPREDRDLIIGDGRLRLK
ncbi:DUF4153 domain-containing protein [Achromobacter sp. NPDC058515]|uniref:DUF4153 domain-containing protein n=1 Tax=Achromobacter sp. NPDC058515 TaxID=3346533 RepID=UPI0036590E0D